MYKNNFCSEVLSELFTCAFQFTLAEPKLKFFGYLTINR